MAVELYIKYDLQVNPVVKELVYPSRRILYKWYKEYLERGGGICQASCPCFLNL